MKRICSLLLTLVLMLGLCACGEKAPTWEEQYDLGIKYLSEGNYAEAIIAFTAAIEIDPKRPEAFLSRGDAYIASGKTAENLAAAQRDYQAALDLNHTLEKAWLSLIDTYIAQEDYEEAMRLLEQALAAVDSDKLREKQEELERLSAPEPGSREYFQAIAEHLDPAVDFDFAIDGIPIATADIYTMAALIGGKIKNDNGDLYVRRGPVCAFKFSDSKLKGDGVDLVGLFEITSMASDFRIWPSEFFAGIAETDTLAQALRKLGFTKEECAYLETCTNIDLYYDADSDSWSLWAKPAEGQDSNCSLWIGERDKLIYSFYYRMKELNTPVDGSAELCYMDIHNQFEFQYNTD